MKYRVLSKFNFFLKISGVFAVSNPSNIFVDNSVAGCSHFGFWYRLVSDDEYLCANKMPMGTFNDNTVHSVGKYGLWIFPSYDPTETGTCNVRGGSWRPAVFSHLASYSCDKGAEFIKSRNIHFTNFLIWDQYSLGIDTKSYDLYSPNSHAISGLNSVYSSVVSDSIIVGDSQATGKGGSPGLALVWDRGQLILNVSFYNFYSDQSAMEVTEIDDVCSLVFYRLFSLIL